MSEKVLTEEGLLAPATTSNDDLLDTDEMEVNAEETNDEEGNNLSEPDPEPEAKDLQEKMLKRRKKTRRTDAEPPPITKIRTTGPQKKSEPKTSLQ